jgi:hypothetical protein
VKLPERLLDYRFSLTDKPRRSCLPGKTHVVGSVSEKKMAVLATCSGRADSDFCRRHQVAACDARELPSQQMCPHVGGEHLCTLTWSARQAKAGAADPEKPPAELPTFIFDNLSLREPVFRSLWRLTGVGCWPMAYTGSSQQLRALGATVSCPAGQCPVRGRPMTMTTASGADRSSATLDELLEEAVGLKLETRASAAAVRHRVQTGHLALPRAVASLRRAVSAPALAGLRRRQKRARRKDKQSRAAAGEYPSPVVSTPASEQAAAKSTGAQHCDSMGFNEFAYACSNCKATGGGASSALRGGRVVGAGRRSEACRLCTGEPLDKLPP